MTKIITISSDDLRHRYFRHVFERNFGGDILKHFVENKKDVHSPPIYNLDSDFLMTHFFYRSLSEFDFFGHRENSSLHSQYCFLAKDEVNSDKVIEEISELNPDFIVTFGCSIIKSELIYRFKKRIINVHLGISPYYRGAGTNFHSLANNEFEYCGYTFMYMDNGIDTGEIIHQRRADIFPGDTPHSIGNRLIKTMINDFAHLLKNFNKVERFDLLNCESSKVYRIKDATEDKTKKLYELFNTDVCERYYKSRMRMRFSPIIEQGFMND